MLNKDTYLIDIIRSIEDLKIKMYEEDHRVVFTGFLKSKDEITVDVHLSVAPCLQSMLSRRGVVTATLWIKVDGATALFDSDMSKNDMNAVGGFLADCDRQVRDQKDAAAFDTLKKNFPFPSIKS